MFAQFDLRARPHVVLRFLEQFEQLVQRLAVDPRRFEQWPALTGYPVDAPVRVVAVRVANVVLHVPDELVGPIEKIDRAVRGDVHRHRAEVRIVGFDQVFHRLAL